MRYDRVAVGFRLVLTWLVVSAGILAWNIYRLAEHDRWVMHTQKVIAGLEDLLSLVRDAETGQRGYLLTGQESYLEPYKSATEEVAGRSRALRQLDALQLLTADNPEQQERFPELREQIERKLAELAEVLRLYDQPGKEAALARMRKGRGRLLMESIRQTVGQMRDEEERLLKVRGREARDSAITVYFALGLGLILTVTLVGVAKRVVYREVVRRQYLEDELRQRNDQLLEASRRKDEFLALLGHELRNPLAPIRNAVELLNRGANYPAVVAQARDIIGRQAAQMTRLVDELLDASRIARGMVQLKRERLDLTGLVRAVVGDHRAELEAVGVELRLEAPPTPVWVEGDVARLTQVVGNLLHNATKFTDPGGRATVRLGEEGSQAVLSVADTGVGIAPEALPRLFEVFSQVPGTRERSKGGLGLGLAVVKGLVELHGGRVRADSDGPGKGTQFTIWLPLLSGAEREAAGKDMESGPSPHSPLAHPPQAPRRVLVIEDNRDAADSLRLLLSLHGYDVAVVYDGQEGLATARQFRPDAVVCDLGLPGLTGFEIARALRADAATAEALLVCVSGYGQDQDRRQAREAGFDAALVKPVDPEALMRLLAAGRDCTS